MNVSLPRALAVSLFVALVLTGCWWDNDEADPPSPGQQSGLPDGLRTAFGADPSQTDTDGDGLSDDFEITRGYPFLKPDSADSNGNGTKDADEDSDGDGLSNTQEQALATSPLTRDTDADGLSDGDEANIHHTDPLRMDTDVDGVSDAREVLNGTDPLVPDAFKVIKSRAVQSIVDPSTGLAESISVEITGAGDLAGKVRVRPASLYPVPGQVGRRYDISLPPSQAGSMQLAQITLPLDLTNANAGDPSKVAIFTIDPKTGFWEALPTTVDVDRKVLVGTSTHFSEFVAANKEALDKANSSLPKTCDSTVKIDAALVVDSSGSMTTNDPSNLRRTAAKQFVALMKADDKSAVVDFDSFATVLQGLTSEVSLLNSAIDRIDSAGGTDIGAGVSTGLGALGAAQTDRARVVILLTDGIGSYNSALTTQMANENIRAFTIGLSGSVDATLLDGIARGTGGIYQQVSSADQLPNVFAQYATVFGDTGKDTDQDGLTDCQEIQGVYVQSLGKVVRTLPDNPDTDGDGLSDGAEVGLPEKVASLQNTPFRSIGFSDPTKSDSDGDSIPDPEEFRIGTNPLSVDSDGDGLSDLAELTVHESDPISRDSDGDGFDDLFEVQNRVDGFDPVTKNYRTVDVVADFFVGFVVGDAGEVNTVPKLLGQLGSGILVFGDVRDLIANLWQKEYANAGIAAIGVVPLAGDIAKSAGTVGKFILKNPTEAFNAVAATERFLGKEIASQVVGLPLRRGAWLKNPFERGRVLEVKIASTLSGKKLLGNYPRIDVFDAGKATSIKTIDFDAKTYQSIANFERKIGRYADDLRTIPDLNGTVDGLPFAIPASSITSRELILGIPRELPADYVAALQRVRNANPELTIVLRVVE